MNSHFEYEIKQLKKRLIVMGSAVEQSIAGSVAAFKEQKPEKAVEVIKADSAINAMEMEIDEQCIRLLALRQPVAIDLRFITSALKINNDLERMGDHAVNIAKYSQNMSEVKGLYVPNDIPDMAKVVQSMVSMSLNSFISGDEKKARAVCEKDDVVDHYDEELSRKLIRQMHNNSELIAQAVNLTLISKNLERIGDLSTNIAEEVIFIYQAKTIKHNIEPDSIEDVRSR